MARQCMTWKTELLTRSKATTIRTERAACGLVVGDDGLLATTCDEPRRWRLMRRRENIVCFNRDHSDYIIAHPLLRIILIITRNAFCGTWYLPHSHVHNERTVPIIMTVCIAHARNSCISTFGLKIWHNHRVPWPRFPLRGGNFGDSHTFKVDIGLLSICMGFQDLLT